MARFHGKLGYYTEEETAPGVISDAIVERSCKGDLLQIAQSQQPTERLNDNITINNRFSVVADPYAYANISNIRYILWMDTKWKVQTVDIRRPRLIINVDGVYNE